MLHTNCSAPAGNVTRTYAGWLSPLSPSLVTTNVTPKAQGTRSPTRALPLTGRLADPRAPWMLEGWNLGAPQPHGRALCSSSSGQWPEEQAGGGPVLGGEDLPPNQTQALGGEGPRRPGEQLPARQESRHTK